MEESPTAGFLPPFITHPQELKTTYDATTNSFHGTYVSPTPWEPKRYLYVKDLMDAKRNEGVVRLCFDTVRTRYCAVKCVPKAFVRKAMEGGDVEQPLNDSGIQRFLTLFANSRGIARWYDCCEDTHWVYFVSEFAHCGDLLTVSNSFGGLQESVIKPLALQVGK
uniref:Protein kinase domain-containing protein n=1 Tax=Chromera velia CCMP2878 TaxID=1169474 RepID=A0A0G4G7P8_9ALVE|eukprot:Cvel_20635.t1-p1 / transcript=Cvel_20635.t1 / gene=Cvel_20635 / organism=Chromera_velia_CCMP2878 / gene_product=hypothetical protein / transcript_product=hypothetical protein / location=Cvel_scaffold1870:34834-36378(+) / protein_length=164 / sequence_SO=supercontig / SO=protein_coding / is_pseudo=false